MFFARHGTVLYEPNHETVVLRSKRGHGEGQHTTNNQQNKSKNREIKHKIRFISLIEKKQEVQICNENQGYR